MQAAESMPIVECVEAVRLKEAHGMIGCASESKEARCARRESYEDIHKPARSVQVRRRRRHWGGRRRQPCRLRTEAGERRWEGNQGRVVARHSRTHRRHRGNRRLRPRGGGSRQRRPHGRHDRPAAGFQGRHHRKGSAGRLGARGGGSNRIAPCGRAHPRHPHAHEPRAQDSDRRREHGALAHLVRQVGRVHGLARRHRNTCRHDLPLRMACTRRP